MAETVSQLMQTQLGNDPLLNFPDDTKSMRNKTQEAEDRALAMWQKFNDYKTEKEQSVRFLSKEGVSRNILDYIRDSVDRMNEYQLKSTHKEDWQSNVFDPVTRSKLISILSILASSRMKSEVLVRPNSIFETKLTSLKKRIYSDLLDAANDKNDEEWQLIWEMFTCMSEGTVFGYESWMRDTRTVEYVKEYNPETGVKTSETIKIDAWDDVFGEIVPIDEIYPETIWVNARDFKQKVKRIFWAKEMTKQAFLDKYGKFENAKEVKVAGEYMHQNIFDWGVQATVKKDNVFVIHFYDEIEDKMCIYANGIEVYNGCLPWNHKRHPFWVAIFEPIHHQFLFGKSLPDKLLSMQDVNNAMFNAILDQLFLALNSPVFIDGEIDGLDDGYLEPGRIYTATPGSKAQRVALGSVDGAAFSVLNLIKQSMEGSSISSQAQGIPTGGRKTKFEVQQLQEGALQLASLFLQMMEHSMKQKYWMRLNNIKQYYSMPSRVKTGRARFKFIELDNRKLTNGKTGKRVIQIVGSKADLPTKQDLATMTKGMTGEDYEADKSRIEPIVLTRDFLMNDEDNLDIRIVPNSSIKQSEAQKKSSDVAFYQLTAANPRIDQEENLLDLVRAFGKSESIVKEEEPQQGIPGMPGSQGMPGMKGMESPQNVGQNAQPNIDMDML